ncbi:hypothetical protein BDQ17DRAFT_864968 [Cyathus striatus]|nr:hypothetical protein BDQ17DRAFT_864968 [Cyathus striatus]
MRRLESQSQMSQRPSLENNGQSSWKLEHLTSEVPVVSLSTFIALCKVCIFRSSFCTGVQLSLYSYLYISLLRHIRNPIPTHIIHGFPLSLLIGRIFIITYVYCHL